MIGIDLIKISRMERFMERFGRKGLRRFLQDEEILHVKNPRSAAGFWAAKEAFAKALGTGIGAECHFHDVCISKTAKGAPFFSIDNRVRQHFSITDSSLSITHDGEYAIAVAVIELAPSDKIQ